MTAPDERPDRPDEPDDEKAWAELVEAFHTAPDDAVEHSWPAAEDLGPDEYAAPDASVGSDEDLSPDDLLAAGLGDDDADTLPSPRPAADDAPEALETDHFVPPPPPPIPRGDLVSRLAWAGVVVPPAVVLVAGLTSVAVPTNVMALLALAFVVGFGTLVSRMRGHHPSDPDDGAVL